METIRGLPEHGRVDCSLCHVDQPASFDCSKRTEGVWRITANALAWGNANAEIVVLGFSKGPSQSGALATTEHDRIAYKGSRLAVGKILAHLGLLPRQDAAALKLSVDRLISDRRGRFHFASLIRCTVERFDRDSGKWKGSGGGMLDRFVASPFGQEVAVRCATRFLSALPAATKLVIMFGLGNRGNYVDETKKLMRLVRPGEWRSLNQVAYTDGRVVFVHVEHFAAQGALLPNWLGENQHDRARLGILAREAVQTAFSRETERQDNRKA